MATMNKGQILQAKENPEASHYSQDVEMVLARKQCESIEAKKIVEVPEK